MEIKSEIILYEPDNSVHIEVIVENETVWLTQSQMSDLFNTTPQNITIHIGRIYQEAELDKASTCKDNLQVQLEGSRKVQRKQKIYNLDVIISVGYRVKSLRGTQFRIWANRIIKDYLLKGYAINQRVDYIEKKLYEHDEKINLLVKTNLLPHEGLFFEGEVFDAYEFVKNLIKAATKSIILIDNYIDDSIITLMCAKSSDVTVSIFTKDISKDLLSAENKFNAQYKGLTLKKFTLSHDRFLIIDESDLYLFGASIKDLGKKWFGVTKMDGSYIPKILLKLP